MHIECEYSISGSWLPSSGIFSPIRHCHSIISTAPGSQNQRMMTLCCSVALGTSSSKSPWSYWRGSRKRHLTFSYITREKSQGLMLELMPILAGGVPLCSGKQGEVFEDARRLLFVIKPQQDFMIIFITSSFTTLGPLKVNNLCLLKLPFKELWKLCRY